MSDPTSTLADLLTGGAEPPVTKLVTARAVPKAAPKPEPRPEPKTVPFLAESPVVGDRPGELTGNTPALSPELSPELSPTAPPGPVPGNPMITTSSGGTSTVSTPPAKTAEQLLIEELQHQLAVARSDQADRRAVGPIFTTDPAADVEPSHLIHIVANDFTALGTTWFRGQEIDVVANRASTVDRLGRSWTEMDDQAQYARFGEIKFRPGPWPGLAWQDEAAAALEASRRGGVPKL